MLGRCVALVLALAFLSAIGGAESHRTCSVAALGSDITLSHSSIFERSSSGKGVVSVSSFRS